MGRTRFLTRIAGSVVFLGALFGMSLLAEKAAKEEIIVIPVAPTPESNAIVLTLAMPQNQQVVPTSPVWVQFRIDGFALGSDSSQFERSVQLPVSDLGQSVHVIVDDRPYFAVNEPAIDPFNESGYFYDMSYKFEIPFSLKNGMHTLRMFPTRSFGESLKGSNTFVITTFYVGSSDSKAFDFSQPFLTYNEPEEQIEWVENRPVLLDFLIANCELSPDGYTVLLTIDGKNQKTLSSWQPYYIYGLNRGRHTIRLELLNRGAKITGPFNNVERAIVIQ